MHSERKSRTHDEHYANLTPDQVISVYSLNKIGYVLYFVRGSFNENLEYGDDVIAVLNRGIDYASVLYNGEIVFNPNIAIRT